MKIVIKVGGSMVFDKNGPKSSYLNKLIPVLRQIKRKNQLIVSIGGGKYLRKYTRNVKTHLTSRQVEWIYIDLLKVNVRLFSSLLNMKPIFSLKEIKPKTSGIIGGFEPGHSTDWGAAVAAKKIRADLFIKLTDVRGIYTKDPDKHKNAKFLKQVSFKELHRIKTSTSPGNYGVLDPSAIDIITRNKLRTIVMSGRNPKNLLKAIKGQRIGSIIC